MKRFGILLVLMLCCGVLYAQTTTKTTNSLSFCGVPFGIDAEEFDKRTDGIEDSIIQMVGAEKVRVCKANLNMPYKARPKIACTLEVSIGDTYGYWILEGFDLLKNMLAIKYGKYQEFTDVKGRKMYVWRLPYGEVSLHRSDENAIIHYCDYNAIKKAFPSLSTMF